MKTLIIRNDNIGDLICTLPLVKALRALTPNDQIDLFVNSYNQDILRYQAEISHVWSYTKERHCPGLFAKIGALIKKGFLLLQLRRFRYDRIIIATHVFNKRSFRIARFLAPKIIYGGVPPCDQKIPPEYYPVSMRDQVHQVLQVFNYGKAIGVKQMAPTRVEVTFSPQEEALIKKKRVEHQQTGRPLVGIQLSARLPKQQWPAARWKELIDALLPIANIQLFWAPGNSRTKAHPGDDPLAYQLAHLYPFQPLKAEPINNLRSLLVGLGACDLVIGPDGGAMHMAAATGTSTLTLFGNILAVSWAPFSPKSYVLQSPSNTILDIHTKDVADKAKEILSFSVDL